MTRRLQAGVLALMLGGLAAALLPPAVRGEHLLVTEIAYELGVGVLFVVAGLWGWASRPDSTIGRLLTVAGLAWLAARVRGNCWGSSHVSDSPSGLTQVNRPATKSDARPVKQISQAILVRSGDLCPYLLSRYEGRHCRLSGPPRRLRCCTVRADERQECR